MKGYWNQPEATSDTLAPDGWMRTGDIGYFDAAVVGAPDPSAGEIPIAFIVRKEGAVLEAEELMQYVAARVP